MSSTGNLDVIINIESLAPPLTGIGWYTRQIVSGVRRTPEVGQLHCFNNYRLVEPDSSDTAAQGQRAEVAGTQTLRSLVRRLPFAYSLRTLVRERSFRRIVRGIGPAVYHEPNYILKSYDGPSVVTIHDLSHVHWPQFHPAERVSHLDKNLARTIARADRVITPSEFTRDEVVSVLGIPRERVTAIHLGVSRDFRPREEQEVRAVLENFGLRFGGYLLVVATLEPRKNIDRLLDAYCRLSKAERSRFPLVLVGANGWRSRALVDRVEKLQKSGGLRALGYVRSSDLPLLYAGAGAFAYPSLYEGFGLPALEALASGIPVLGSDTSAMKEVVADAGLLINPADVDSIYSGLSRVLLDDEFRAAARRKGPERASGFHWDRCVQRTVDVYREVMK